MSYIFESIQILNEDVDNKDFINESDDVYSNNVILEDLINPINEEQRLQEEEHIDILDLNNASNMAEDDVSLLNVEDSHVISPQKSLLLNKENITILSKDAESYKETMFGIEGAAFHSRLPPKEMTPDEMIKFGVSNMHQFVEIRNRILYLWLKNPKEQLRLEQVLQQIEAPYNNNATLIKSIHQYLERHGYINFGLCYRVQEVNVQRREKVIVVGAGIAGVICAKQLQRLGMSVLVVEARDRVGGRIATFRIENNAAELGAMIFHGIYGNPLSILAQQNAMEMTPLALNFRLYAQNGHVVNHEQCVKIFKIFNEIINEAVEMRNSMKGNNDKGDMKSLAVVFDLIIQKRMIDAKNSYIIQHNTLKYKTKIYQSKKQELDIISKKLNNAKFNPNVLFEHRVAVRRGENYNILNNKDIKIKQYEKSLKALEKQYKTLLNEINELESDIQELENTMPEKLFLSELDKQILFWHMADFEMSQGGPLDELALEHFNPIKDCEFVGSSSMVRNGMSILPMTLTEGLDVRTNMAVRTIRYNNNGVELIVENTKSSLQKHVLTADIAVCTLPIGVLQASLSGQNDELNNIVRFEPELPEWKRAAINRMGVGLTNKIVLYFDSVFWDPTVNCFGCLNNQYCAKGELYLFYCLHKNPVLVANISGDSASLMELVADIDIVDRCVFVLRNIFGKDKVPFPRDTSISRWGLDPCSRGSHSIAGVETLSTDFDTLAAPVFFRSEDDVDMEDTVPPRLFFAGEHTSTNYSGTVHGAFLSGLREAGNIANYYLDKPIDENNVEDATLI